MTLAEIIQIIIGGLTLLVTAFVPIMIYWLQKKHEKEIEKISKQQNEKVLSDKANEFLIDHEDERDYLPWCTLASALHRHEHHSRKIYTDFCKCPVELQNEILKQAGFTIVTITDRKWINDSFDRIRQFIKEKNLGENLLYDNAKYFHRGFERYRELEWTNTPSIFNSIEKNDLLRAFTSGKIDIGSYIEEYLRLKSNSDDVNKESILPPIDYVERMQDLRNCEEKEVCRWVMEIVYYISIIIHNTTISSADDILSENYTDAIAETYEDRYYEILLTVYYTFSYKQEGTSEKAKKKKTKK